MSADPDGRGALSTEQALDASRELDALSLEEAFEVFQREDERVAAAVAAARPAILRATELVAAALAAGGRLFYVGAGTSGRLGVLDAAECPPTFQSDPRQVQGILAGGPEAMFRAVEGAEDDDRAAAGALGALQEHDVVFGIAAGGTTPFVHGALAHARRAGARSVFLACVPFEAAPDAADVSIRVVTGPEVLTGSTRLKAATATKLVLNRVSTLAMVRLGKVHGNLMVDLHASNAKLRARAVRILHALCGVDAERAQALLEEAAGHVKLAALMHQRGLGRQAAERALERAGGSLRRALAG